MAGQKKHKALRIVLLSLLFVIVCGLGYVAWLTANYKRTLKEKIPAMVLKSSDSLYHISFSDIKVNVFKKWISISNVKLWADSNQANILRQQGRYSPNTMSWVTTPLVELSGIKWDDVLRSKTFNCSRLIVHDPVWYMQTIKHHPDLSDIEEPSNGKPLVTRMQVVRFEILNPDVHYHYVGDKNTYNCYLKGGVANLYNWAIDRDTTKDTSVFLYARYGSVRPHQFRLYKDDKIYTVDNPNIDFNTTANAVTLKNVKIEHMTDVTRQGGIPLETYNCKFPVLEFVNFNWKRLLHRDVFIASAIHANSPYIDVHYIRENFPGDKNKTGSFPNQIIREFIKTYIKTLYVKNARFLYNEPGKKNENALFQFDDITGTFENITNIDKRIEENKNCIVKLHAKFMNKSPVEATFNLSLADPKGHFSVTGSLSNLDGEDVSKQAEAFTIAKVTSFHLSRMDGHVEGNESHANGEFTMLYSDLKISLFKFKSDERKSKNGPFSFIADATILYPSNPMPGKDVRRVTTTLPRDPHNGFIYLIWQNVYLGAQKTAVRDEKLLMLAGGDKEDTDAAKNDHKANDGDEPKKKGFFQRLFGKKLFAKKK